MKVMVRPAINALKEKNHVVSACVERLHLSVTTWVLGRRYIHYVIGDTLYVRFADPVDDGRFEPYVPN